MSDELDTPAQQTAGGETNPTNVSMAGTLDDLLPFEARGYLDDRVLPVLLLAMTALVRERPENPVDYVAHFLLRHSKAAARTFVEVPPSG